jgi:large conductance mechanosensitive channel
MSTIKDTALAHREKALSLLEEFRAFAFKGNVIDLAVGVIIGAAFGGVIGVLLPGEQSYLKWKWVIGGQEILYGQFLGEVLNFLIVALALFLVIRKFMGWVMRVRKEEAGKVPAMTKDQELLTEIRDLLKGSRPPEGGTARGEIQV